MSSLPLVERDRTGFVARIPARTRPPDPRAWLDEVLAQVDGAGGGRLVLWVEDVDDRLDEEARRAGLVPWRDLLQMRCPLPVDRGDLAVRSFRPEDAEAFLEVNNRAFHWHPEQGSLTATDLRARMAEPWFDPEGFLLHERDGRLAGFCWTKVHPEDEAAGEPAMGEIYAIAVDPDFHGQGIGEPLTRAGLAWLADRGLGVGMLYVESDNHAGLRIYERIGFTVHGVDRAYVAERP